MSGVQLINQSPLLIEREAFDSHAKPEEEILVVMSPYNGLIPVLMSVILWSRIGRWRFTLFMVMMREQSSILVDD